MSENTPDPAPEQAQPAQAVPDSQLPAPAPEADPHQGTVAPPVAAAQPDPTPPVSAPSSQPQAGSTSAQAPEAESSGPAPSPAPGPGAADQPTGPDPTQAPSGASNETSPEPSGSTSSSAPADEEDAPEPVKADEPATAAPIDPTPAPQEPQPGGVGAEQPEVKDSEPQRAVTMAEATAGDEQLSSVTASPSVMVRLRDVYQHIENFFARNPQLERSLGADLKSGLNTLEKLNSGGGAAPVGDSAPASAPASPEDAEAETQRREESEPVSPGPADPTVHAEGPPASQ